MQQLSFFPTIREVNKRKSEIFKMYSDEGIDQLPTADHWYKYLCETMDMMMDINMTIGGDAESAMFWFMESGWTFDEKYINFATDTGQFTAQGVIKQCSKTKQRLI